MSTSFACCAPRLRCNCAAADVDDVYQTKHRDPSDTARPRCIQAQAAAVLKGASPVSARGSPLQPGGRTQWVQPSFTLGPFRAAAGPPAGAVRRRVPACCRVSACCRSCSAVQIPIRRDKAHRVLLTTGVSLNISQPYRHSH